MKKNTQRTKIISVLLSLIFVMGLVLSGCGGPENLEEMAKNDEEFKQQVEAFSTSGMTIDIKGNTITYTYKYDQTFDDATAAQMTTQLESAMDSMSSTFTSLKDQLVDETGFKDIALKVVYTDGNDKELYSAEF